MIDLDDFKAVNDTHGHPLGDRVLIEVAGRLRRAARAGAVFRYGGEEFAVICRRPTATKPPSRPSACALAVCEQTDRPRWRQGLRVSGSLGVGPLLAQRDVAELVEVADQALLAAKAAGKKSRGDPRSLTLDHDTGSLPEGRRRSPGRRRSSRGRVAAAKSHAATPPNA
jgi:diguanylate cyclase (GGDEF)-like protein